MPETRETCVLWSGGKDCFSALLADREATGGGLDEVLLVTCGPPQAAFRCHPLGVVARQAAGLGVPHLRVEIAGEDWQAAYRAAFARLRDEHGVRRLVTGDLVREPWLAAAAEASGLELVLPLLALGERVAVLDFAASRGVRATVTGVRAEHHRPGFLGQSIGRALLDEVGLAAVPGFDPCGENGEFHTVVTAYGDQRYYDGDPATLAHVERDGIWSLDFEPRWLAPDAA